MSRSEQMKQANAVQAGLSGVAKDIYLKGIAGLSQCKDVAKKGNGGRGYVIKS